MFTDDDFKAMMLLMTSNLDDSEKPCVGIFWYSPQRNELFGTVKAKEGDKNYATSGFGGMCTCKELHKDVWKKEFNKRRYSKNGNYGINLFVGDYKSKPRGRIFYKSETNEYFIMVGEWIEEYPEAIDCVVNEFKLSGHNYQFIKNFHWDIGNGFGD